MSYERRDKRIAAKEPQGLSSYHVHSPSLFHHNVTHKGCRLWLVRRRRSKGRVMRRPCLKVFDDRNIETQHTDKHVDSKHESKTQYSWCCCHLQCRGSGAACLLLAFGAGCWWCVLLAVRLCELVLQSDYLIPT